MRYITQPLGGNSFRSQETVGGLIADGVALHTENEITGKIAEGFLFLIIGQKSFRKTVFTFWRVSI